MGNWTLLGSVLAYSNLLEFSGCAFECCDLFALCSARRGQRTSSDKDLHLIQMISLAYYTSENLNEFFFHLNIESLPCAKHGSVVWGNRKQVIVICEFTDILSSLSHKTGLLMREGLTGMKTIESL